MPGFLQWGAGELGDGRRGSQDLLAKGLPKGWPRWELYDLRLLPGRDPTLSGGWELSASLNRLLSRLLS